MERQKAEELLAAGASWEPGLNNGISLFALFALFGQSALNNANNANNEAA